MLPWMYVGLTHPWDLGNPLQSRDVRYDKKKASDIPPVYPSAHW